LFMDFTSPYSSGNLIFSGNNTIGLKNWGSITGSTAMTFQPLPDGTPANISLHASSVTFAQKQTNIPGNMHVFGDGVVFSGVMEMTGCITVSGTSITTQKDLTCDSGTLILEEDPYTTKNATFLFNTGTLTVPRVWIKSGSKIIANCVGADCVLNGELMNHGSIQLSTYNTESLHIRGNYTQAYNASLHLDHLTSYIHGPLVQVTGPAALYGDLHYTHKSDSTDSDNSVNVVVIQASSIIGKFVGLPIDDAANGTTALLLVDYSSPNKVILTTSLASPGPMKWFGLAWYIWIGILAAIVVGVIGVTVFIVKRKNRNNYMPVR